MVNRVRLRACYTPREALRLLSLIAVGLLVGGYLAGFVMHASKQRMGNDLDTATLVGLSVAKQQLASSDVAIASNGLCKYAEHSQSNKDNITLVFVGDVSFARDIDSQASAAGSFTFPFWNIEHHITAADFAFANLESPFVPQTSNDEHQNKRILLGGNPKGVAALVKVGFDAVTLSTNHVLDFGVTALEFTIGELEAAGLATVGISKGPTYSRQRPFLIQSKGMKIGVLSYCLLSECLKPREKNDKGPAMFHERFAKKEIMSLRSAVDFVVVVMHWGREYYQIPSVRQQSVAKQLDEMGVDVVLGHHAHVLQDHSFVQAKKFVAFSLGNFVFDSHACRSADNRHIDFEHSVACQKLYPYMRHGVLRNVRQTRIYRLTFAKDGLLDVSYLPCSIAMEGTEGNDVKFQPVQTGDWITACGKNDLACYSC